MIRRAGWILLGILLWSALLNIYVRLLEPTAEPEAIQLDAQCTKIVCST